MAKNPEHNVTDGTFIKEQVCEMLEELNHQLACKNLRQIMLDYFCKLERVFNLLMLSSQIFKIADRYLHVFQKRSM